RLERWRRRQHLDGRVRSARGKRRSRRSLDPDLGTAGALDRILEADGHLAVVGRGRRPIARLAFGRAISGRLRRPFASPEHEQVEEDESEKGGRGGNGVGRTTAWFP